MAWPWWWRVSLYPLIMKVGGMWSGDVLILSSLLLAAALPEIQPLSQTDLWQGVIPSKLLLHSFTKQEFDRTAQNIQKMLLLTQGQNLNIRTVFQDMNGYREYVGVEVFQTTTRTAPGISVCRPSSSEKTSSCSTSPTIIARDILVKCISV